MSKTPQDVLRQIKDDGIEFVDLKFSDLHGKWQHLTVCTDMIEEESFTEGLAFDGSSIRGWKAINASDMAMIPDPSTAWVDPFYRHKTLSMICSIGEPRSGQPYDRCPRALAQRALSYPHTKIIWSKSADLSSYQYHVNSNSSSYSLCWEFIGIESFSRFFHVYFY